MKDYMATTKKLSTEFKATCHEKGLQLLEFQASIGLAAAILEALIDAISTHQRLEVIDTYHLERFYSYLIDFSANCAKDIRDNNFVRHFASRRFRGGVERLSLAMQYELLLFFSGFDTSFQALIRSDRKNLQSFAAHTTNFIDDPEGRQFWEKQFGTDV